MFTLSKRGLQNRSVVSAVPRDRGYFGITEKKMKTTIIGYVGSILGVYSVPQGL